MMKLKKDVDPSQYLFYLPDGPSRDRVELLHEIRNRLAHGQSCSVEQVFGFLNAYPFMW